ncbi:MAG TPA: polymer-forming cytoskeletal protein [Steroidobacteraceae bacterium]|nr:polymer-forming cytoskeletal protein [Steroidobacteraceae bacterium]
MDSSDKPRDDGSVLGPTLRFKGELTAGEDLLIEGQIAGSIRHSRRLTIGRQGHVKAQIEGHIVSIAGTVEGDVQAQTSVAVMETGRLSGDIRAPSVSIVDGADFNGNVIMDTSKRSHGRDTDKR